MDAYALPLQVYGAGLIFARVGALAMLIPGLGEQAVPPRIRLAFAFLFALVLYPIERANLPPIPSSVGGIGAQIAIELLIGLGFVIVKLTLALDGYREAQAINRA